MKVNWLQLVKLLAGVIIPSVVPHGDLLAPLVVHGIEQAEAAQGKTGAEKLVIASDLVDTGIAGINAAAGTTKIDPAAIHALVQEGISTVVDTANIVKAKGLPTVVQ